MEIGKDRGFRFFFFMEGMEDSPLICCVGRGERKREEEGPRKAGAKARGTGKPEVWMEKGSGRRDSRQKKEKKKEEKP